jgi:hypothetical protein
MSMLGSDEFLAARLRLDISQANICFALTFRVAKDSPPLLAVHVGLGLIVALLDVIVHIEISKTMLGLANLWSLAPDSEDL